MAKDQSRDVHLLILVLHHRYSFTVVPDGDGVGLSGNGRKDVKRLMEQNLKYTVRSRRQPKISSQVQVDIRWF